MKLPVLTMWQQEGEGISDKYLKLRVYDDLWDNGSTKNSQ